MRAPNGAKMDPKRTLFQRVKIMRIHCKKHGLGSQTSLFSWVKNQVFDFDSKKRLFHNLAFCLGRKPIFQVYGPICSPFRGCFLGYFFGPLFWDKTWKGLVSVAKNSVFGWSLVLGYVSKTWFFSKKRAWKLTVNPSAFLGPFLEIVTTPTQELDSGRVYE